MTFAKYVGAAVVAALTTVGAQAATLSVLGGSSATLPTTFGPFTPAGVMALADTGVADIGDPITVFTQSNNTAANGLVLSGMNELKFTYLGSEAVFFNEFQVAGSTVLTNGGFSPVGASFTTMVMDGFVPIGFESQGRFTIENTGLTSVSGIRLAFSEVFNGGQSVIAFLDDRTTDIDYDDLVIRIDVVPIPVPPAIAALMTGLAGLTLLGRRTRRTSV